MTVDVRGDETSLTAFPEAGLELPSTRLQGWRTTCAARIVKKEAMRAHRRREGLPVPRG